MKKLAARVARLLNRPRLLHYGDVFLAATGMALYYDRDHLLGAHGLNAVGCIIFGACVVGAKAVIESYRKAIPPASPPVTVLQNFTSTTASETQTAEPPTS